MVKQIVPFVVHGTGTGVAQQLNVPGDVPHTFESDTLPPFGGADSAPSPLSYTLGALTGCNQISAQLVAKELGVTLGEFTFAATGDFDPSVFVSGADGNANFDAVRVEASVQTDADDATFATLVSELERRCPVTQLFKRSGLDYTSTWTALPLEAAS
jgi:putative redox protein